MVRRDPALTASPATRSPLQPPEKGGIHNWRQLAGASSSWWAWKWAGDLERRRRLSCQKLAAARAREVPARLRSAARQASLRHWMGMLLMRAAALSRPWATCWRTHVASVCAQQPPARRDGAARLARRPLTGVRSQKRSCWQAVQSLTASAHWCSTAASDKFIQDPMSITFIAGVGFYETAVCRVRNQGLSFCEGKLSSFCKLQRIGAQQRPATCSGVRRLYNSARVLHNYGVPCRDRSRRCCADIRMFA